MGPQFASDKQSRHWRRPATSQTFPSSQSECARQPTHTPVATSHTIPGQSWSWEHFGRQTPVLGWHTSPESQVTPSQGSALQLSLAGKHWPPEHVKPVGHCPDTHAASQYPTPATRSKAHVPLSQSVSAVHSLHNDEETSTHCPPAQVWEAPHSSGRVQPPTSSTCVVSLPASPGEVVGANSPLAHPTKRTNTAVH